MESVGDAGAERLLIVLGMGLNDAFSLTARDAL
jgi:hypothetical protein